MTLNNLLKMCRSFLLLAGSSNPQLAEKMSQALDQPLVSRKAKPFSSGEPCVEVHDNVRGQHVVILQSVGRNIDGRSTNYYFMELLLLMDACKRSNAKSITVVIPCYPYARQDKKDRPRVPISSKLTADILELAGATRVVTVDLHSAQIQGMFSRPVDNLYAIGIMSDYLKTIMDPFTDVLVSPDNGGSKRIEAYAARLSLPHLIMHKSRDYSKESHVMKSIIIGEVDDLVGKRAIVVDDMIDTGGTMLKCFDSLKEAGIKSVILVVTHGIFSGDGARRIQESSMVEKVIATNSLPMDFPGFDKLTVIDLGPLLADVVRCIFSGGSVSKFFDS